MKRLKSLLSLALCAAALPTAHAQGSASYPERPIRLIVPYAVGGATDVIGRVMARYLGEAVGQSIVVENRPGATGNIGTAAAVKAPADGYTIFLCSIGNCSVNSSLYANPGFDLFKDIAPVVLLGASINVLTASPKSDINSVEELVAKARRGQLSYASSGVGASNHLAGELFKKMAGVELLHVPYKGSGPAITDLLGGQIDVFFDNEPSIAPFVKTGKVKGLAVTGKGRSANLPELRSMEEIGYKGFVIEPWFAIGAPAGTPAAVIQKLNAAFNKALKDPAVHKSMVDAGINPLGGAPAVLGRHIRAEHDKWADLIRSQKISAE